MATTYTATCPKCHKVDNYGRHPGIVKCPKCGLPLSVKIKQP